MTKVVINKCFGGFGLSGEAMKQYEFLSGKEFLRWKVDRDDPVLVKIVSSMGNKANSRYACLKIVEIPDDVEWVVQEYDGKEWVAEAHKTWG